MLHLYKSRVSPKCLHAYSKFSMVLQDRFTVQLEYILFCLEEGKTEDAHQETLRYGIQTSHVICVLVNVCRFCFIF